MYLKDVDVHALRIEKVEPVSSPKKGAGCRPITIWRTFPAAMTYAAGIEPGPVALAISAPRKMAGHPLGTCSRLTRSGP
jgi:hypothetical protein